MHVNPQVPVTQEKTQCSSTFLPFLYLLFFCQTYFTSYFTCWFGSSLSEMILPGNAASARGSAVGNDLPMCHGWWLISLLFFFLPSPISLQRSMKKKVKKKNNHQTWNLIYLSLILGPAFPLSVFYPSLWCWLLKVIWNTWLVTQSETIKLAQLGSWCARPSRHSKT